MGILGGNPVSDLLKLLQRKYSSEGRAFKSDFKAIE
jgi:hypothetical protein